ncbi:hypothetical protein GCM10010503_20270 [Streptomyces lucensis JCM 4490]|uniref:Uncharacterized protein n=1 Tax=Streptomyces lucensis JCM 4490 TaxID=1306176 RepID=A0A918J1U9_9ACTN|nr:DUF6397 family protein [Streptomyces lucensis]GGW43533.1 hypothetical protein GCM10010503_20270 [Streptomyces lucensis JCM 4490]
MPASTFGPPATCALGRAARELGLSRDEFDLAVQLGRIRTVPGGSGGAGRRVERAEIDRLRAQDGFPEALQEQVRVVGTAQGAALMGIPAGRFTRLARLGLLAPVAFHLNRYRTVVWLYMARELRDFTSDAENARLLKGRTPETLRGLLEAGVDLRARNWRGRRLGFLLRRAGDPWARAGAVAAFLAPVEVADIVRDPNERACLNRALPAPPAHGVPGSPAAHLAERLMTAQDTDEIEWLRSELTRAIEEARALPPARRPAGRGAGPGARRTARPVAPMARTVTRTPELMARACEPGGEPALRASERCGDGPAVRPPSPSAARDRRPGQGPHRRARGLRGWLRRREPRPVRA